MTMLCGQCNRRMSVTKVGAVGKYEDSDNCISGDIYSCIEGCDTKVFVIDSATKPYEAVIGEEVIDFIIRG